MLDKIPLETFRVFDAACREMNFSRAGRELNITQVAVSRRIKGLEDHPWSLYSTGEHPRWNLTLLMKEVLVPVASPDYLMRLGLMADSLTAEDIAGLDLIDYERFNAHWISFRQWFGRIATPLKGKLPRPRLSFSTYIMAVEAALREGIALGSVGLIEGYLHSGALVTVGRDRVESGFGYYLGTPSFRPLSPEAVLLHQQLLVNISQSF